jgi:4-hydroxy-tetrahydrodipicolinate synthase
MPHVLDAERLNTVQLVPLTPMSADGKRVLPDVMNAFIGHLARSGIRVFLPAAGTGEFHSLSVEEIVECVAATRAGAGPDATVIAPIGFGLHHALAIGKRAEEAGADGFLVMPPVHPYLCDAGIKDYLTVLASELPRPLLTYKKGPIPSDALLAEMGVAGTLAGIKYGENNLDAAAQLIAKLRGRAVVSCGTAERHAPYFHLAQAIGYTSGAGNLCPRLTLAMHRALVAGDYADALRIQGVLRPIEDYRARAGDSFNISMLKAAMKATGRNFGPARLPQRQISAAEEQEILALVRPILAAESAL